MIFLSESGIGKPFERVGCSLTFPIGDRQHDSFRVGWSIRRQGDVGAPEGHIIGESMLSKLRRESSQNLLGVPLFLLFREADAHGVEHVGNLRRLRMIPKEILPGRDGRVALTCLPE
jgi:hypothetical protein